MQIISSPPTFVSAEDHANLTASTPSSFADIPPVLLHLEEEVEVLLEPAHPGLSAADGKIKGKLWVTESQLSFLAADMKGFAIPYPQLTLHAVSPASDSSPAHLYCQVESKPSQPDSNGQADGDDEDGEDMDMTELSIFVADPAAINKIFDALSKGASLHADPAADSEQPNFFGMADGDDEEDGAFDDANEDGDEHDGGRSRVDFQTLDSRFRPY